MDTYVCVIISIFDNFFAPLLFQHMQLRPPQHLVANVPCFEQTFNNHWQVYLKAMHLQALLEWVCLSVEWVCLSLESIFLGGADTYVTKFLTARKVAFRTLLVSRHDAQASCILIICFFFDDIMCLKKYDQSLSTFNLQN